MNVVKTVAFSAALICASRAAALTIAQGVLFGTITSGFATAEFNNPRQYQQIDLTGRVIKIDFKVDKIFSPNNRKIFYLNAEFSYDLPVPNVFNWEPYKNGESQATREFMKIWTGCSLMGSI